MSHTTQYINGNLRISTNKATGYYAFERPLHAHKTWVPMFTAKSAEELLETAKVHYERMRQDNPEKYYTSFSYYNSVNSPCNFGYNSKCMSQ